MHLTLPETLLVRLSALLAARMGLHFPQERWADLERGIAAASTQLGQPNVESFARQLLTTSLTQREMETLATCMTVGETYFFREKQSLDALEQHIFPELLRARADGQHRLRVWSAGCCTGEEPYSIAMMLDQLIPDAEVWNITILATDINLAFLRKAEEGKYGEWSFRSTPGWIKDRYFHSLKNGRFKLDEKIRKRVTFSCLNLADDIYPSPTNNTNAMDIILCRNVMMYFTAEQVRAVVAKFHHALVDGGWLIVSPAETSSSLFSSFTSVAYSGATFYRKNAGSMVSCNVSYTPALLDNAITTFSPLVDELIPAAEAFREHVQAKKKDADTVRNDEEKLLQQEQLIRTARDCANQGHLDEAAELCRKAISAAKLDPVSYYLLSAIQREQGLSDDAAQSLMRAIYLAPDFVIAHYALGNLRHAQGKRSEARRHFDNALASLRTHSPDEILPESDGLTAARLTEIIESIRSIRTELTANL